VRITEASGDSSDILLAGHVTATTMTSDDAARFN